MSFIDDVRREREQLACTLKAHPGIRRLVEDLYPDEAHFIYELLQNAEDTGATEVSFALHDGSLEFEHNGRPFCERDVRDITDVGKAVEAMREEKIGRFGVGFKAVFAYSEEPHIWSPTFCFKISDLVLPWELDSRQELGERTRFQFPFNNPKKPRQRAYAEIEAGLRRLAETTLLFLFSLQTIRWKIDERCSGVVSRIEHPAAEFGERPPKGRHIEVRIESNGTDEQNGITTKSCHFLRYDEPLEGLERRWISVAFNLSCLPDVDVFKPTKPLSEQMRIVPALREQDPYGRVAIFFPAEKEHSGLCFHVHAPFVPELSRASIKATEANTPLFAQLASLSAMVLHDIRDQGLLTGGFLAVLPNGNDAIGQSFKPVRDSIINAMKYESLTPTYSGGHAPARCLRQAKASLKTLLSASDLNFLTGPTECSLEWTIGATQRNSRVDRLLSTLGIEEWGVEELVKTLKEKTLDNVNPSRPTQGIVDGSDEEFMAWLRAKSSAWHQELYALLFSDYVDNAGWQRASREENLKPLKIIRLENGEYSIGSKCYFAPKGMEGSSNVPHVDKAVWSSGRVSEQQNNAKRFLEAVGVHECGVEDLVKSILDTCYTTKAIELVRHLPEFAGMHHQHIDIFIQLVEEQAETASMFGAYSLFKRDDGSFGKPRQAYLDVPFLETGLSAYHSLFAGRGNVGALAHEYLHCGIDLDRFVRFTRALGVQAHLAVTSTKCELNPAREHLHSGDVRKASNDSWKRINSDYDVWEFGHLTAAKTKAASRLIWSTMMNVVKPEHLLAIYKRNNESQQRTAPSALVHRLISACWVPQSDKGFVRPADVSREQLPEGFPFDLGWPWIIAIRFGANAPREAAEQAAANTLGLDTESLELAREITTLPPETRSQIRAELARWRATELPETESPDPVRRAELVREETQNASLPITAKRRRTVQVGLEEVKDQAKQYLREMYTNADGDMICQVCATALPFKLDDGNYYFEAVRFLEELKRRHSLNYLALCPNHSAMFQYANGCQEDLVDAFTEMPGNHLAIILAQREVTIYFTTKHRDDLKVVIQAERDQNPADR